jgi:hypothetical protein
LAVFPRLGIVVKKEANKVEQIQLFDVK